MCNFQKLRAGRRLKTGLVVNMSEDNRKWLLTDLYLKESFVNLVNKKAENGEFAASFCCVFFDIRGFNSYYLKNGFDEGYEVLHFVANKIMNAFPVDIVGKLEDDEFAVITDIEDVEKFIKRIQMDFGEVYIHTDMELWAGIYPIRAEDRDAELIFQNAKIACDHCDRNGAGISVFDKSVVDEKILMQHYVVHHLESAIENKEICVYYQPIFHTLSGKVCGLEALARWNSTEYGPLLPGDFVPVLENSRKIYLLDCFVIRQVCIDQKAVYDRGMEPVPVSINLTRLDFALTDILDYLEEEMDKNELPRHLIQIEISEAEITTDRKGLKQELEKFHQKGFKIVFDDFGSEYSSLHILNDMPFDTIKINSNFLSGFNNDIRSRIIMKNIINMSKELGITTMMGSVEDNEILEFLKQTGCEKTQGHLYCEALPLWYFPDGKYPYEYETHEERKFYEKIGEVNILSQTPIDTSFTYLDSEATYLNQLPLAIFEFDKNSFKVLMSSRDFEEIFSPLFIDKINNVERLFNSKEHNFSREVRSLAKQCINDREIHMMEFVTENGYNRVMLRQVTKDEDTGKIAIIATAEHMTEDDPTTRTIKLNDNLKFLYSIYTRVDMVSVDDDSFDIIYENKSKYNIDVKKGKFSDAVKDYAEKAVYIEDRENFINFFSYNDLDERAREYANDHIIDYFRTIDINGEYNWLMYLIIPVISDGRRNFIACARSINAERMRKLPEISQSGTEYYDMPSDPIFLLLASDAFTNTLGYGSFEQFLRNTFYIEADLTEDKTVYMHLGQSGLISDYGETGFIELPYGEVIKSMVFSEVVEDDYDKMMTFYNRDRLIAEYESGRTSGTIVYLERAGVTNEPRFQNACYKLRKKRDGKLHVYFLRYDIDEFTRTNETIRRLAQNDTLTGLFNRTTINSIADALMTDKLTKNLSVVLLDLDYFKQINDRYGHDCGDCVLKDAAMRMQKYLGEDSYPARIGGDEFLTIIRNTPPETVEKLLNDFSKMDKYVEYNGHKVSYSMSVGYAVYPYDTDTYNKLYQSADLALYEVKMNGKNNYRKYTKDMVKSERKELGFNPATISDSLPGGFLVYRNDEAAEILFANKNLLDIYGCKSMEEFREFTGNSFKGCVHEADYEIVQSSIASEIAADDEYDYVQYRARTKDGKIKIIEDYGRILHSANNGDLFYVFILDYEQKHQLYKSIVDNIHKHWQEDN